MSWSKDAVQHPDAAPWSWLTWTSWLWQDGKGMKGGNDGRGVDRTDDRRQLRQIPRGTIRPRRTATSIRKWLPLKTINLKFSDTRSAFYCKWLMMFNLKLLRIIMWGGSGCYYEAGVITLGLKWLPIKGENAPNIEISSRSKRIFILDLIIEIRASILGHMNWGGQFGIIRTFLKIALTCIQRILRRWWLILSNFPKQSHLLLAKSKLT